MRERETSVRLGYLCSVELGAGEDGLRAELADMSREDLEEVLVEAIPRLMDAEYQAAREIERFQRRSAKRSAKPAG